MSRSDPPEPRRAPTAAWMACAALLLLGQMASIELFRRLDVAEPSGNVAEHLANALAVHDAWQRGNLDLVQHPALAFYPPLMYLVTAAMHAVTDRGTLAAACTAMLNVVVLFISVYLLGRRTMGPYAALVAAVVSSGLPGVVYYSHTYYPDFILCAIVPLTLWLLLRCERFLRLVPSLALGFVVALGFLVKWSYGIYVVLPAAFVFAQSLVPSSERSRVPSLRNATLALLVLVAVAGPWYHRNLPKVTRAIVEVHDSHATQRWDGQDAWSPLQSLRFYSLHLYNGVLGPPVALLTVVALVIALVRSRREDDARRLAALCMMGAVGGFSLFSVSFDRYILPVAAVAGFMATDVVARWRRPGPWLLFVLAIPYAINPYLWMIVMEHPDWARFGKVRAFTFVFPDGNLDRHAYRPLVRLPAVRGSDAEGLLAAVEQDAKMRAIPVNLLLLTGNHDLFRLRQLVASQSFGLLHLDIQPVVVRPRWWVHPNHPDDDPPPRASFEDIGYLVVDDAWMRERHAALRGFSGELPVPLRDPSRAQRVGRFLQGGVGNPCFTLYRLK